MIQLVPRFVSIFIQALRLFIYSLTFLFIQLFDTHLFVHDWLCPPCACLPPADDHFLAFVGSAAAVFNSVGRIIWGALCDRTSYRVSREPGRRGRDGSSGELSVTGPRTGWVGNQGEGTGKVIRDCGEAEGWYRAFSRSSGTFYWTKGRVYVAVLKWL